MPCSFMSLQTSTALVAIAIVPTVLQRDWNRLGILTAA